MLAVLGWMAAVLIGVMLGLMGGGGSILTVPILVYLFGLDPTQATGNSLFIVGATSVLGAFAYLRQRMLDIRAAAVFAIPSLVGVYLTRLALLPALPHHLFSVGSLAITRDKALLLLFAVLLLVSAYRMIRSGSQEAVASAQAIKHHRLALYGLLVGVLTGLLGAGGGFLIVPALALLAHLPMKQAVGTSLIIIAANALTGFVGALQAGMGVNWPFLLGVTGLAVLGVGIGSRLERRISGVKLQPAFGWFILAIGLVILSKELWR